MIWVILSLEKTPIFFISLSLYGSNHNEFSRKFSWVTMVLIEKQTKQQIV